MFFNIFKNDVFSPIEMTDAMTVTVPPPLLLGSFGDRLFPVFRSRTDTIAIRRRQNQFSLIPTRPLGAPLPQLERIDDKIVPFILHSVAKGSTIQASSLRGIISEPETMQLRTVAQELLERGARLQTDLEVTREHMRLGAIMGQVYDADGVTVLDDWFLNWDVPAPTPYSLGLTVATTNVRQKIEILRETVVYNNEGGWVPGAEVHALCGTNFFALLTSHPNIEKFWLNYAMAQDLTRSVGDQFTFGDITWHKYRGTADGTTLHIDPDQAHLFPVGTDAFQRAQGPAEFFPFLNEPGRDVYSMTIPDDDRGMWITIEIYSYPLYICRRPKMLQIATI